MTRVSGNDSDTAQDTPLTTPTFDSRSAFAWTLRAGESAKLGLPQRRELQQDASAQGESDDSVRRAAHTPVYETPTSAPSSAFAWTLRAGEIARLERRAAVLLAA